MRGAGKVVPRGALGGAGMHGGSGSAGAASTPTEAASAQALASCASLPPKASGSVIRQGPQAISSLPDAEWPGGSPAPAAAGHCAPGSSCASGHNPGTVAPLQQSKTSRGARTWRCAPWLQHSPLDSHHKSGSSSASQGGGGSAALVAEVWPKGLTGAATAVALRSGAPVVLRSTRLGSCRVAQPQPPQTADNSTRCGSAGSSAPGADDSDGGGDIWRAGVSSGTTGGEGGGGGPGAPLILSSSARTARFMFCDGSKNLPGSFYEVRRPGANGRRLEQTGLQDWHECWLKWASHKLLATVRA